MIQKQAMICYFCLFIHAFLSIAQEKNLQRHTVKNVTLQTPVKFSSPAPSGVEAFCLVHPEDATPGKERFEIHLVFISREMMENGAMDERTSLEYVKAVFLGTSKKAEKKNERTFLGQKVIGEMLSKKIPRPQMMEVYLFSLKDGGKLALSFVYEKEMEPGEAENIMRTVAETLQEKE